MGIYGQDWASYQSASPSTAGLSFVFVKVTEGLSYTNPEWRSQRDDVKAGGLVWGAYHYPHMNNPDRAEADFFLAQVDFQPGDMIVLDWEGYDAANQSVSAAEQLAYKEDYLQYMKSRMPHNPVGTYMNVDYWNRVDTTGHVGDFLWIATAGRPAGDPGIRAPWLFHQYSDNPVDSDYCPLGSTAELRSWAMSFAQTVPPQEDVVTPQDIQDIAAAVWNYQVPDWGVGPDGAPRALGTSKAAYWHQVWGDVFAAQILSAVAASKLTPAEVAQALADGTLRVQVTVAPAVPAVHG